MADSFTDVTYNSLGGRLVKSVGGALIGLLLAVLSFPLLWWNEGRINLADVAKKAVAVTADGSGGGEGALVSVTGPVTTTDQVGDPSYLKPGNYLRLERNAEMWAWHETKHEREEKQLGGSSKTITTYDYDEGWSSHPQDSAEFRHEEGHDNPPMRVASQIFRATSAKLGAFTFDPGEAELPSAEKLQPAPGDYLVGNVQRGGTRTSEVGPTVAGEYIFDGQGSLAHPRVGDERISFLAVKPLASATLFGKRAGSTLVAAMVGDGDRFFRVLHGTREEAIDTLQTEHTVTTWLLRLAGFLMMWLGAAAVFRPINTFLDIVPMVGGAGRFLVTLVLFPITLTVSLAVIIVSAIAHSLILSALVALGIIVGAIVYFKKRRPAAAAAAA
ncbi:MAG: TMEM43 family protein [Deltaproteobacteria bacterium]|nr:TMEM43 family protein [Deltaproteobacteria bacterium]